MRAQTAGPGHFGPCPQASARCATEFEEVSWCEVLRTSDLLMGFPCVEALWPRFWLQQQLRSLRSAGEQKGTHNGCREAMVCGPEVAQPLDAFESRVYWRSCNKKAYWYQHRPVPERFTAGWRHDHRRSTQRNGSPQDSSAAIQALGSAGWWQEALALFEVALRLNSRGRDFDTSQL